MTKLGSKNEDKILKDLEKAEEEEMKAFVDIVNHQKPKAKKAQNKKAPKKAKRAKRR